MRYRMQINATICFSVVAKSKAKARKEAEKLIDTSFLCDGHEIDIGSKDTYAVVYAEDDFDTTIEIINIENDDTGKT